MKQKTKNLLKNIARIIQYVSSVAVLVILIALLVGHMFLIDAYMF